MEVGNGRVEALLQAIKIFGDFSITFLEPRKILRLFDKEPSTKISNTRILEDQNDQVYLASTNGYRYKIGEGKNESFLIENFLGFFAVLLVGLLILKILFIFLNIPKAVVMATTMFNIFLGLYLFDIQMICVIELSIHRILSTKNIFYAVSYFLSVAIIVILCFELYRALKVFEKISKYSEHQKSTKSK